MYEPSDEHFKNFAKTLSVKLKVYDNASYTDANFVASQKQQVEELDSLETEFRQTLIASSEGKTVYDAFIGLIRDKKKNILDARPFFRERQEIFTLSISKALQNRNAYDLFPFHFNYHFIEFVVNGTPIGPTLDISLQKIYRKIKAIRQKLIEINTPLAIARATQFYKKTPRNHMTRMDLIQVALEGLISGIDKYVCPYDNNTYRHMIIGRITGNLIESYCLDQDTMLVPYGEAPKPIKDFRSGDRINAVDELGRPIVTEVVALHDHGTIEGFEVCFNDGYKVICSKNHKFLTPQGMVALEDIVTFGMEVFCEPITQNGWVADPLSADIFNQSGMASPQKGMYGLSLDSTGRKGSNDEFGKELKGPKETRGVEISMRNGFPYAPPESLAHGRVQPMPNDLEGVFERKSFQVEAEQPRASKKELRSREGDVYATTTKRPRVSCKTLGQSKRNFQSLAQRKPGQVQRKHEKSMERKKALQNGSLVAIQRDPNLGHYSDSMWGRTQTGGLRVSGSQNMGRSGRRLSFSRNDQTTSRKNQTAGFYFKGGGFGPQGRSPDSCELSVLQSTKQNTRNEARMATTIYANAPLTSTGGLVPRKIVRVRSVGERRMYDLEVSHPKHNFLLPNGVVTSNSETAIHFFPSDKRKLYNANKALRRCEDPEDFNEIAIKVNELAKQEHYRTDPEEIRNLLAATHSSSTDATITNKDSATPSVSTGQDYGSKLASDEASRPDNSYEKQELLGKMAVAIKSLTVFEQKILKLKGIN